MPEKKVHSGYTPVQDYDGKEFALPNGSEMSQLAKTHKEEVSEAALNYVKNTYHIKAKVTNLVGARDAVVAHLKSDELPTYYTSVIVDVADAKVTGNVSEVEGTVESSIMSGIYVKAYEKEFENLEAFCEKMAKEYPVIGMRNDAIERVHDLGVVRPYYYVSVLKEASLDAYNAYKKNHDITSKQLRTAIKEGSSEIDPSIVLTFYMKEKHRDPDGKLANQIIERFKTTKGFPPGMYTILVNSNEVLTRTGNDKSSKGTTPSKDEIHVN
ncbi:lipoprotein [Fictibacillus macauensis ZFHKF-1]|uniref:Lipoprotein n=1 Tax=Fictibacillus macauensis ZFHKF-1 TaxID=1196324 RepID=I8AES3_9BACL|nr:DUF1672 family protein [Fictibacillus macauensis]EIT84092.1 lipoprotein [Fictibacillus macauensis ZFHKF-1]